MKTRLPVDEWTRDAGLLPAPLADAVHFLVTAVDSYEQREGVLELVNACMRYAAAVALAARIQYGPGAGAPDESNVSTHLRTLRDQTLALGSWRTLAQELVRPFARRPEEHPIPALVRMFHGPGCALPAIQALIEYRNKTIHGGGKDPIAVARWVEEALGPLSELLRASTEVWSHWRLVLPGDRPDPASPTPRRQEAALLRGLWPASGRWQRIELQGRGQVVPNELALVDDAGVPRVQLHPILLFTVLDGTTREAVCALDHRMRRAGTAYRDVRTEKEVPRADAWDVVESVIPGVASGPAQDEQRPYRGLERFKGSDRAVFFGRDANADEIVRALRDDTFVIVTGASGAGKSSILEAGVVPRMTDHRALLVRPGVWCERALAQALCEVLQEPADEIEREVRNHARSLGGRVADACRVGGLRLLVVVDQAEELVTLSSGTAADAFCRVVSSAASDRDGLVRVVAAVRQDHLGAFCEIPALGGIAGRSIRAVATPAPEELRECLVGPARQLRYDVDPQIADDMVEKLQRSRAALALMQVCADQMWAVRDRRWRQITWREYELVGRVEGAIAKHAERVFDTLGDAVRRGAARRILVRLAAGGAHGIASLQELEAVAGDDAGAALERLMDARLVSTRDGPDGTVFELTHDALVTHWGALAGWIQEDGEAEKLLQRISSAARVWETGGRQPDDLLPEGRQIDEALSLLNREGDRVRPGSSVSVFVETSRARADRRLRKRAWVRGAIWSLALSALVLGAAAMWNGKEAKEQGRRARDGALLTAARTLVAEDPLVASLLLLEVSRKDSPEVPALAFELGRRPVPYAILRGHEGSVVTAAFSSDGTRALTASLDGTARVWTVRGRSVAVLRGRGGAVVDAAFSPDGRIVATASADGMARLWDAEHGVTTAILAGHAGPLTSVAFSPDGQAVATSSKDGSLRVWSADGRGAARVLARDGRPMWGFAFSSDGAEVLTASKEGFASRRADGSGDASEVSGSAYLDDSFRVEGMPSTRWLHGAAGNDPPWNARSGLMYPLTSVSFSPDGRRILTVFRGIARVWSTADGANEPLDLEVHGADVTRAAFSPADMRIATGHDDGTARLWNTDTNGSPVVYKAGAFALTAVAFSPDGRWLLTAGRDGSVAIWDTTEQGPVESGRGLWNPSTGVGPPLAYRLEIPRVYSPDGQRMITVDLGGRLPELYRPGRDPVPLQHDSNVFYAAFSPDGRLGLTAAVDGIVRIWNAETAKPIAALRGERGPIHAAAISPDGKRVVWKPYGASALLANADGSGAPTRLEWHEPDAPMALHDPFAFSPDGRILAGTEESAVWIIDLDGSRRPRRFVGHADNVQAIAFSRDGRRVVTGSSDRTVRVWSIDDPAASTMLRGHQKPVTDVSFSPDGSRILSVSEDGARVWSADGAGEPLNLASEGDGMLLATLDARFSEDGRKVRTTSFDRYRIWRVDSRDLLSLLGGRTVACLAPAERSRFLGETDREARNGYAGCERQHGR